MGTRNLTIVQLDGAYKVAQYGQWDGYPDCGGIEALTFARKLADPAFRSRFEANLRKCSFLTESEIEELNDKILREKIADWREVYPELSRDTGRRILDLIFNADNGLRLKNEIDFAADGLFCEWAWLIDLDANRFEAYKGFISKTPLGPEHRFAFLNEKAKDGYYPIQKVAEWNLSSLPTELAFLETFKAAED